MMQQTEKYQLNLIETSDAFSPAALNENAQKVEAAISAEAAAEAAARAAGDAALDARVTVLEAPKVVFGSYTGADRYGTQTINLDFTPKLVVTVEARPSNILPSIAILDSKLYHIGETVNCAEITENGFIVTGYMNYLNNSYRYMAFG